MKAKIVWMKEYGDDGFIAHVAVDSGDWEEITEEEYILLSHWVHTVKATYYGERPAIVRQDEISMKERVLQCKEAARRQDEKEKREKVEKEHKRIEKEKRKEENERKLAKLLAKKYDLSNATE